MPSFVFRQQSHAFLRMCKFRALSLGCHREPPLDRDDRFDFRCFAHLPIWLVSGRVLRWTILRTSKFGMVCVFCRSSFSSNSLAEICGQHEIRTLYKPFLVYRLKTQCRHSQVNQTTHSYKHNNIVSYSYSNTLTLTTSHPTKAPRNITRDSNRSHTNL